jgi:hypothetical protein
MVADSVHNHICKKAYSELRAKIATAVTRCRVRGEEFALH